MNNKLQLIVMLTYHDQTVENCFEIFEQCKNSKACFFGIKEEFLSIDEMKRVFAYMKQCNKNTVLEVVAYDEEKCIKGAEMAVECKCDILMGTKFYDSVNEICQKNKIKYMPFVGDVEGRPSILKGEIDEIIGEAQQCLEKNVYGFDLLGYRYTGNQLELIRKFVSQVDAPVCIAGNINSFDKLNQLINIEPWAFTIGGAFFDNKFEGSFEEQINKVCMYLNQERGVK